MTTALLWKEYRQQRTVWVSIAMLAILLVVILAETMGKGTGLQVFHDTNIRTLLNTVVFTLAIAYGLVSGALLLAGENDDGTLVFLDSLTGWRGVLWTRKCLAGAFFTVSQSMVLAVLAIGLGFGSWHSAIILPLVGLDALAWGLLAGALCSSVLTAVLAGIGFMVVTWAVPLTFLFFDSWEHITIHIALGLAAGFGSRRIFCKDDQTRVAEEQRVVRYLLPPFLRDVRVLMWLMIRQGRWVFLAGIVAAVGLCFTGQLAPNVFWPFGTMLLGVAFGLAAFAPDQNGQIRFLGAQRFPVGRIWGVKILLWGSALAVLSVLAWDLATQGSTRATLKGDDYWFAKWLGRREHETLGLSPLMLLGIWPIYGFCFGQLFGMAARRPAIAVILAAIITPPIIALWLPSLLVGGVPIWQVLIIPALALMTSRLATWPWMCGRLWTLKPLCGMAGSAGLAALALTSCFYYRAVEVPDIGEPFDVKAFIASLPSAEANEAGRRLRNAAIEMVQRPNQTPNQQDDIQNSWTLFHNVTTEGWPQDDESIRSQLDWLFQGEWVAKAETAARLPLGMVQDPRVTNLKDDGGSDLYRYNAMARVFILRGLQVQAKGDSRKSLNYFETALGLSRQVKNFATSHVFETGHQMEMSALLGLEPWLKKVGPDKALLADALGMLRKHEATNPDPANNIKADYVIYRNSVDSVVMRQWRRDDPWAIAYLVPWEEKRQDRIVRAFAAGCLRAVNNPIRKVIVESRWNVAKKADVLPELALMYGLPPAEGPGSDLSARQWGAFINQCVAQRRSSLFFLPSLLSAYGKRVLHAEEVVVALSLYRADHGKLPAKLADLVPDYFPAGLPLDPFNGQPFNYRISRVEVFGIPLETGKALIWIDIDPSFQRSVPVWHK